MSFGIRSTLGRDRWSITIKPTPVKDIGVPSAVMTEIENERDIKAKDKESRDIWWEAIESKTHSKLTNLKNYEENDL